MAVDLCNNFNCGQVYSIINDESIPTKQRILIQFDTKTLETYGSVYSIPYSITFTESNWAQNFQPRKLRFVPGSEDHTVLTT